MLTNFNIFDKFSEHVSGFDGADTQQKMIPHETQRHQKDQVSMLSHLPWQLLVCTHSLIEVEFRSDARKNDIRMYAIQTIEN